MLLIYNIEAIYIYAINIYRLYICGEKEGICQELLFIPLFSKGYIF